MSPCLSARRFHLQCWAEESRRGKAGGSKAACGGDLDARHTVHDDQMLAPVALH